MGNEETINPLWGFVKGLLLVVMVALLGYIAYCEYNGKRIFSEEQAVVPITSTVETVPSIEEAMVTWQQDVQRNDDYQLYLALPPMIMQSIYERIGTQPTIKQVVNEYRLNKEFYISKQIAKQFKPDISGPDADNIKKVEITTTVEEPIIKPKTIPLVPSDSLK